MNQIEMGPATSVHRKKVGANLGRVNLAVATTSGPPVRAGTRVAHMRIISVNAWGGAMLDELVPWIAASGVVRRLGRRRLGGSRRHG